ncbi:hypothetical protein QFC24_004288 [Naganishia onofrii]|uniref:Uncharacterized protein n=1 Tax=Naganishia onofrii TaxID=1851511 RepID=A0ACC2XEJ4_9TREE|nr:hypothetical protein QFC24_004288 [Naganishia onofrii]
MPQELLYFPPYYVVVGIYRLFTDQHLRTAVWDKVKHATVRGVAVAAVYVAATYSAQRWFVQNFLMSGYGLFGKKSIKPPPEILETGLSWLQRIDTVEYTTILFILPQLSYLLNYFIRRNLRLARSRAYDLTVQSRGKPESFWSKGYVEEWEQPPIIQGLNDPKGTKGKQQEGALSWILLRVLTTFGTLKSVILIPISPYLPIFNILFTSATRGLYTARSLHQPYFQAKGLTPLEVELWLEERKWGYRAFGMAASALESLPIVGLGFSVSNRIGAAMWAFDLEKRQHRFANGELRKLKPEETGVLGFGKVLAVEGQNEERKLEEKARLKGKELETISQPPPLPPRH